MNHPIFDVWTFLGVAAIGVGVLCAIITEKRRERHAKNFSLSDEDRQTSLAVLKEMHRRELWEGDVSDELVLGIITFHLKYPYIKTRNPYEKEVLQLFKNAKKGKLR